MKNKIIEPVRGIMEEKELVEWLKKEYNYSNEYLENCDDPEKHNVGVATFWLVTGINGTCREVLRIMGKLRELE